MLSRDAQDVVVAGEIDLDQHALVGHVVQQRRGLVLVHDIHPVADAVGLGLLNGVPDMATKPFGRHQPRRKLARVQADMDVGIEAA